MSQQSSSSPSVRSVLRRWDVVLCFCLVLLPLLVPGITIFGHDGLLGSDRAQYHLPYVDFLHQSLQQGEIPFWNPFVYGGTPEFGNPERAPMYLPHLLLLLFTKPIMMLKLKFLLHLALAGVGCFLLLRSMSVGRGLAFLGAAILEWSGFSITKIALPNVGDSAAWIPLMLFLNLWFSRRPSLGRALVYTPFAGCMLLLFFPQITLTLVLILALFGIARHVKFRSREVGVQRDKVARKMHRIVLPILEIGTIIALLRYPNNSQNARTGLGAIGEGLIVGVALCWGGWVLMRRIRVSIDWPSLWLWARGFTGVWVLAGAIAAPQLAVTGEMIFYSNQAKIEHGPNAFFSGALSYGYFQEFIRHSSLAILKESVNNMALGPAIYLLVLLGVLGGFHRRHRAFFLYAIAAVSAMVFYFGTPDFLRVLIHIPFFGKFAGLTRYQAFLNVFLIVLAILSAQLWLRRLSPRLRKLVRIAIFIALIVNLVFLFFHQDAYWERLRKDPHWKVPPPVVQMLKRHLGPDERFNIDMRRATERLENYQPMLMIGMKYQLPTLATIAPIRMQAYDDWMHTHNNSLGVEHDDYRAGFFEPASTPWMRAMRVSLYLFPPEEKPPVNTPALRLIDEVDGWNLYADTGIAPVAWPEKEPWHQTPRFLIPSGWSAKIVKKELQRTQIQVHNPAGETWMVLSVASYPGWSAWVNGSPAKTQVAYGFLQAIQVPAGGSTVQIEYRPQSFVYGWLIFLWASWAWVVLLVLWRMEIGNATKAFPGARLLAAGLVAWGGVVAVPVGWAALHSVPSSLGARCLEFLVMMALAALASAVFSRLAFRKGGDGSNG